MLASRSRVLFSHGQLHEALLPGDSVVVQALPRRTLLAWSTGVILAGCAVLCLIMGHGSVSLRGSEVSDAAGSQIAQVSEVNLGQVWNSSKNSSVELSQHLQKDSRESFFSFKKMAAGFLSVGIFTVFVYVKRFYLYARWYCCPTPFQQEAQECGVSVYAFWVIAHVFLTPHHSELADKTDEELQQRYQHLRGLDCISEEQKRCIVEWRARCRVIEAKESTHKQAPGLVDLWKYYPQGSPFTAVMVGMTGAGKTSLLNLLNAISQVTGELTAEAIGKFAQTRQEDLQAFGPGQSSTKHVKVYELDVGGVRLRLVDTPGYADTEGKHKPLIDQEHEKNVIGELQKLGKINCLIIVMHCTCNRYTTTTDRVLSLITATLPKEFLRNVVFLFTFAGSESDVAVPLDQIAKDFLENHIPDSRCLNNPHAKLNNPRSNMPLDEKEAAIRTGLKQVTDLFDCIKGFQPVPTLRFQKLLEQRELIAQRLDALHVRFRTEMDLSQQLADMKQRLQSDMAVPVETRITKVFSLQKAQKNKFPALPVRCMVQECGWYRESTVWERLAGLPQCFRCEGVTVTDGFYYAEKQYRSAVPVLNPTDTVKTKVQKVEISIDQSRKQRASMYKEIQDAIEHYESLGLQHAFGNNLRSLFLAVQQAQGVLREDGDLQALQLQMQGRLAAFIELEQQKPAPEDELSQVFDWNDLR